MEAWQKVFTCNSSSETGKKGRVYGPIKGQQEKYEREEVKMRGKTITSHGYVLIFVGRTHH
jgi:hypothetical protein